MNRFGRGASLKYSAGLGLSILLLPATFGPAGSAQAQEEWRSGTQFESAPGQDRDIDPPSNKVPTESPTPETLIRRWPKAARLAGAAMIVKYGRPNHATKGVLVWLNNGPWEKTVVYQPKFLGKRSTDFIEQTIVYRVPYEKIGDLKRFDRRIEVNAITGRLSARSDSEALNFLVLNLADEISTGNRSVENASNFRWKTEDLSKAGKSSPYMERFLFPSRNDMRTEGLDKNAYDWNVRP